MDEIFREIKSIGMIEDLKKIPTIQERYRLIEEAVTIANISKTNFSFYSPDEQLYIIYLVQEKGIAMGLCPYFYIFFSKKNQKFHHICKATSEKKRTRCGGLTQICDKGVYKGT